MRAVDIIIKKRDGLELTTEEIQTFIRGYSTGEIPDYQAAAWAMAVILNGMSDRETTDLTLAMVASGDQIDLSSVVPIAVDKHSTGGVGDKTTLVTGPIVAACGLPVGKMSGRGLGFSGGTLDKMESIDGYQCQLSPETIMKQLGEIGIVLAGQTGDLAPADGKLYALRDVTGTVPSIPLIASSIMSKKIAAGAHKIVLDVKTGVGAFMENLEEANALAKLMVSIGQLSGREVVALLSDMNQPLGEAVGNALELKEAVETLQGGGPEDFLEHCLVVASHMLVLGQKAADLVAGREMAETALSDGSALAKFKQLVGAQGGSLDQIEDLSLLPTATFISSLNSQETGWVSEVNARIVGETSVMLGAGRQKKTDSIDHAVGIMVHIKVGDEVKQGDALFTIHANRNETLQEAMRMLTMAVKISDRAVEPLPLFYGVIS
ncbi:MAG: thymidine phosphorylase [Anaerolineaceae bacterium]|nr:thymidine phosphorylase [Anaerolineaceae bacterium]